MYFSVAEIFEKNLIYVIKPQMHLPARPRYFDYNMSHENCLLNSCNFSSVCYRRGWRSGNSLN